MAVLLGPARDGRCTPVARAGADDAGARRWRDHQQRVDLRQAAPRLRADLQCDQGRIDDVFEEPFVITPFNKNKQALIGHDLPHIRS